MSPWSSATVVAIRRETARAKTFVLRLPAPTDFLAGQHVVVRLTAPDGYTAQRSYSVASAPDGGDRLELTVERLEDGEVSTFLHDVVEVGDELELRGPLGGFFVWDGASPALLVGGGSGVVPLMSMLRLARRTERADLLRVVVSVRSPDELLFASELPGPETTVVYTRAAPAGSPRPPGRLLPTDLPELSDLSDLPGDVTAFVCGSTGFCNAAGELVVAHGVPIGRVRVERFGPTG
jgi:ferredoxin-NADP reductase